ncbi:MAG: hypothetical protein V7K53_33935 [Nostoc sp.]
MLVTNGQAVVGTKTNVAILAHAITKEEASVPSIDICTVTFYLL